MKTYKGLSLVEMMVALALGLILSLALLGVYLSQKKIYSTTTAQSTLQSAQNAIYELIGPTIRSAGFCGCASINKAISNLNAGGPAPLGTLNTLATMIQGYDAALGTTINIAQTNQANSVRVADWLPSLETTLNGNVQAVSDVLIVLGATQGSQPISVTSILSGDVSMTLQNTTGLTAPQFAAISDCSKVTVFLITGISGTTISHTAGVSQLTNASNAFAVDYQVGSLVVPLSQTAFFVARDVSGQSALVRATLNSNGTWSMQSLVPGVDTMQVLYGIGTSGLITQYVPASAVTNWSQVYAVRLGFLLTGQSGSGANASTSYSVLGTTVTVPADNRLRHVYELNINLRNAL